MNVLGIDPGKAGAAVLLVGKEDHAVLAADDVVKGARWEAVHQQVTGWLRSMHASYPIDLAVLELHAGRPGEGAVSARTIGIGWGLWLGALSGLGIHTIMPTAARWTGVMLADLPGEGKERSIALCSAQLPHINLLPGRRRRPHDGIADAACLALYGRRGQ